MREILNVGGREIVAEISEKENPLFNVVIAHGANNDMNNDIISEAFNLLSADFTVLKFDFSFTVGNERVERGRDLGELRACIERLGGKNIILIGKSYGGYLSILAAEEKKYDIKSVIVLGLPLHNINGEGNFELFAPLKKGEITAYFINGDSDPYCKREIFDKELPGARSYWIAGADHSFRAVGKGSDERNREEVVSIIKKIVYSKEG